MSKQVRVYGWVEQNCCAIGLCYKDILIDDDQEIVVFDNGQIAHAEGAGTGYWFLTAENAKRQVLKFWRNERDNAIDALKLCRNYLIDEEIPSYE